MHALNALARGWPSSPVLRTQLVAAPAAGADWSVTCPGERVWQFESVSFTLVSDANAANRAARLVVGDGNESVYAIQPGAVQAASLTVGYSYVAGYCAVPAATVGGTLTCAMPAIVLLPGWTIGSAIANVQATDQISAIVCTMLEVFTGTVEHERRIERRIIDNADAIAELIALEGAST